jgi:hypothetical protein
VESDRVLFLQCSVLEHSRDASIVLFIYKVCLGKIGVSLL